MSRLPTIAHLNAMLRNAVSLTDPLIERIPCGYRVMRAAADYTDADRAWFKRPIGGV